MIEKLPDWPEGYTPPERVNEALVWLKINEVIEAVNHLQMSKPPHVIKAWMEGVGDHD